MNKYSILLIGLVYFHGFAQNEYPLAIGNTWYYTITYQFFNLPLPPSHSTISVIGDSIMSNGKRYWILDKFDMLGGKYIRCDSGNVYYWQSGNEKRVFNLHTSRGIIDTIRWAGFFTSRCTGEYQSTLFAKPTNILQYSLGGLLFGDLTIAKGFGYIRYEYHADEPVRTDVWNLTGCVISDTLFGTTDVRQAIQGLPAQFALFQNYPNPFNPSTDVRYQLPVSSIVKLTVYDMLGREIAVLADGKQNAGTHQRQWNAKGFPSGVYFYRLQTESFTETRKLVLLH